MVWRFLHFVIEVYFLACVVGSGRQVWWSLRNGHLDTRWGGISRSGRPAVYWLLMANSSFWAAASFADPP
jgi:hypothetical protein